jgi:hypothetical protein
MEKALKKWYEEIYDAVIPPILDLLWSMGTVIPQKIAEEENLSPESGYIGKNWVSRFLDRNPDLASKYSKHMDRQK